MTLEGTLCYSCGSLFNANAPKCDDFDRFNRTQRARCRPGEGCLMYTWQKSGTKKGKQYYIYSYVIFCYLFKYWFLADLEL